MHSDVRIRAEARRSRSNSGNANFLFGVILVAALSVEGRIGLGLNVLFSELALLTLIVVVPLNSSRLLYWPAYFLGFVIWVLFASIALVVSDELGITLTAVRNISTLLATLAVFGLAGFSNAQMFKFFRVLAWAAAITAIFGIWQAFAGYDQAPTIYSLGLAGDLEASHLGWVLRWKIGNLHESGLMLNQVALSIGFHAFSNNFAEFLVYGSIATFALRRARLIGALWFSAVSCLIVVALILSGSRTCWIGWSIVASHHAFCTIRNPTYRIAIGAATIVAIAAVMVSQAQEYFKYDSLGTLAGRVSLDSASVDAITHSVSAFLFGGNIFDYYNNNTQSPHIMLLYLALIFGVPMAISAAAFVGWFAINTYRWTREARERYDRILAQSAFIATLWFVLYGLTWSVIETGQSGMMWAVFASMSLSRPVASRLARTRSGPSKRPARYVAATGRSFAVHGRKP